MSFSLVPRAGSTPRCPIAVKEYRDVLLQELLSIAEEEEVVRNVETESKSSVTGQLRLYLSKGEVTIRMKIEERHRPPY